MYLLIMESFYESKNIEIKVVDREEIEKIADQEFVRKSKYAILQDGTFIKNDWAYSTSYSYEVYEIISGKLDLNDFVTGQTKSKIQQLDKEEKEERENKEIEERALYERLKAKYEKGK